MTCIVVLVNGASAAGKSRLLAGVERIAADSGVLADLRTVQRFTTRAARERESLQGENRHVTPVAFAAAVGAGHVDVHWRRHISEDHENRYGFALGRELTAGGVLILSANNYLQWPEQPLLAELRAQGRLMVVRVCASRATRRARLEERLPPLSAAELASRMDDVAPEQLPPADHLVPNDPEFQTFAEWEFLRLVTAFRFASARWEKRLQAASAMGAA